MDHHKTAQCKTAGMNSKSDDGMKRNPSALSCYLNVHGLAVKMGVNGRLLH